MRVVSTAWIESTLAAFEAVSCLYSHAAVNHASREVPFDIFILHGFDKITDAFAAPLREKHIILHDATAVAHAAGARFPNLTACIGAEQGQKYEYYCFIRWIVLAEILKNEPFVHTDLDLFFQRPLTDVAQLFRGLTGTFGSPCLTSVSHMTWLETYSDALGKMASNRSHFQEQIKYTGNEFRANISSDQDLVAALETVGWLPKGGLSSLFDRYSIFINPLWPYQHKPSEPMQFSRDEKGDRLQDKPVLFWHLQNNASDYISRYALLMSYKGTWMERYLPVRLSLPFIQLAPSAENFAFETIKTLAWQQIREAMQHSRSIDDMNGAQFFARSWVCNWFVVSGQGRGLFTGDYWWEDGVFT